MKGIKLLLTLLSLALGSFSKQISVLKYKGGNECSNALVGVPIKSISPSSSLINEFTFCGKYYFRFLRRSFLMSIEPDLIMDIFDFENKKGEVLYQDAYYPFYFDNQNVTPDSWLYICLAVSSTNIKIIWNGEILYKNHRFDVPKEVNKDMKIWLGGALFSKDIDNRRFEGVIVNANFWNYTLKDDDLTSITANNKIPAIRSESYNLLSTINFQNSSCIDYLILDENDVLFQGSQHPENFLIKYKTDFDSSNYICEGYGGNLTLPKNEEELKNLGYDILQSEVCVSAFLGLKKSNNEEILDLKSNPVLGLKWHLSQPNGGDTQKCINTWDSYLNDIECDQKHCFFCHIPEKHMFVLRGPIPTNMERKYFVTMNKKQTEIRGITQTECLWNEGKWNFGMNLQLDNATNNMPPAGLRNWNKGIKLKFTQCKQNEFTCHTYGHCISMDKRCDGHPDCSLDSSDENRCKIMTLTEGYDKKYPPIKNVTTFISLKVYEIRDIDELHMSYTVEFKITMQWFDSRIFFRNLKPSSYENLLDNSEIQKIWTPELFFISSKNFFMKAGQQSESGSGDVLIIRKGLPHQNKLTEIDEDYLYPGNENPILMVNFFLLKLSCTFELEWYVCMIE